MSGTPVDPNTPTDEVTDFFNSLSEGENEPTEVEEAVDAETEEVEEPVEEEPTEVDPEVTEKPAEETVAETEAEVPEPTSEWENRYKELQSLKDKQLAEMQKRIEQQEQQTQQFLEYQQYQQQMAEQQAMQAQQNVSQQQLDQGIQDDPVSTLQWVLSNRPDLAGTSISMIRTHHGHEVADQATAAYQQFMYEQQAQLVQSQQQQMMEYQQSLEAPKVIEQGLNYIIEDLSGSYGEDFQRLSGRVNELVTENRAQLRGSDPESVRNFLERQFLTAQREDLINKGKKRASKPREVGSADFVESEAPAGRPQVTGDDSFVNEMVEAWKADTYR